MKYIRDLDAFSWSSWSLTAAAAKPMSMIWMKPKKSPALVIRFVI
jgi:hypothetical protein